VIQKEFSLLSLQDISGDSFTDSWTRLEAKQSVQGITLIANVGT
jgi:hypothetical protein